MDLILSILAIIFVVMGIVGIIAGLMSLRLISIYNMQKYEIVKGDIEDITTLTKGKRNFAYPTLHFFYKEVEYHVQSGLSIPSTDKVLPPSGKAFEIGDEIEVRIYRNDISSAILNEQYILDRIKSEARAILTFGVVSAVIGSLIFMI